MTSTGWTCPKCGASNAPWVPQCPCTTNLIPSPIRDLPCPMIPGPYTDPYMHDPSPRAPYRDIRPGIFGWEVWC